MDGKTKNENYNSLYEPIGNYGIIGNLHTVALVSIKGSIDFMCFTRFDSPTIFAKLLDARKGGSFSICPLMKNVDNKQLYHPNTNILISRFFAEEGIAEVIDYMPVNEHENNCVLIRKVTMVRGSVKFRMNCAPHFNYAGADHKTATDGEALLFTPSESEQPALRLLSDRELNISGQEGISEFKLRESETAHFVLESADNDAHQDVSLEEYIEETYHSTINFWQNWISKSTYHGPWLEVVNRSALTLKLLTSHKFGSMIAAATFGLPEHVSSTRNWDYRYTWIRDAAFTIYVFLQLGFLEEAESFVMWISGLCHRQQMQLMYAIDGEKSLDEKCIDYLEGYKGSQPVTIGNDAHKQFQLDIYGELIDTIFTFTEGGGAISYELWQSIETHVNFVIEHWHEPDHSIWEIRGEKREFLYSRIMCWVAIDRAIKIGEKKSFPYDFVKWRKVRDNIYKDIYHNFWNEDKQAYVQSKGSTMLDASTLIMPLVEIVSPYSDRWQKTMEAIGKELRSDVLIYRYREQKEDIDGIKGTEGTFTICSFWHVECLARSGQIEKAHEHFEKMLGYANHLGLFSEQIGMRGEHLGNFPQALTHLGLIGAVIEMNKAPDRRNKKSMPVRAKEQPDFSKEPVAEKHEFVENG